MTENEKMSYSPETWNLPYLQFAAILLNGLERLAEIQKSALAVYTDVARKSADAIAPTIPVPTSSLFELAEQAIREFLQIQVRLLDLMLKQSTANRQALRTRSEENFEGEVARLMFDSTDCLLNMQKKALEFITHQNETFAAEVLQPGPDGFSQSPMQMPEPDTSAIIEAQKRFWDVTLKPFRMMNAEA